MIATWPIQVAIFEALNAAPRTYPVFDAVPEKQSLPYIVIGEFTGTPDDELAVKSADLSVMIHAWSGHAGKSEAHQMLDFVRGRLDHAALDGGVWAVTEDFAEVMEDRESTAARRIYHAAARYRIRAN